MAPRSKLPNCRECKEPAYEELQAADGAIHVIETHLIGCKAAPLVPFDPDPRATKMVIRYDRAKAHHCKVKL